MLEIIEGFPAEKIILEITEHDYVENYEDFSCALAPLRRRGVKIAIDDAGAGYSSMCTSSTSGQISSSSTSA